MDVNNINPVLNAFTEVISQLGFEKIERNDLTVTGPVLKNKGLIVNIDVLDQIKGTIIINMDMESAMQLASKMMMGKVVTALNELEQSAIAEMGNMVSAHACTNFARVGRRGLNISPPSVIIGQNGHVKIQSPAAIVVKYLVDEIPIDVCVGLY